MKNDIHIGAIIRHELNCQRHSPAWLAAQLACDRSNIYKILKKKSIDTQLLLRISQIMNKNLFSPYYDRITARSAKNIDDIEDIEIFDDFEYIEDDEDLEDFETAEEPSAHPPYDTTH